MSRSNALYLVIPASGRIWRSPSVAITPARTPSLDPDWSDYIVSFACGDIYFRTSLTQQQQTMVTISTLVALGTEPQLKLHINVGFNVGLTEEKIVGALIHCIPYIGFPRALNALTLLKEVMAERRLAPNSPAD